MPTYNCASFINNAIDSVLYQTCKDFEIFVVDDGSTDKTLDILNKYGSKIKYVYQKHSGQQEARKKGLEICSGRYIAFLDADDYWLPDKLEKQIEFMELCPDLDLIFSDFTNFNEQGLFNKSHFRNNLSLMSIPSHMIEEVKNNYKKFIKDITYYYLKGNFVLPSTILIKREVCVSLYILDAKYSPREMYGFFTKNMHRTKIGFVDESLTRRRIHSNNITYNKVADFYNNTISICHSALNYPWISKHSRKFLRNEIPKSYFKLGIYYFVKGEVIKARESFKKSFRSLTHFFSAGIFLILTYMTSASFIFFLKRIKKSVMTTSKIR